MAPETIEEQIQKIALFFRYGTKQKFFITIGAALFGLAASISELNDDFLKLPQELN
ncbi:MAG: hypothetical protein L0Y39_07595 [Methylococcaceae bacterium]|nr:hypothetical protein [Methylococcaceae bacterium]